MKSKVRYNGGTESYFGDIKPDKLIVGKEYEVISSEDMGFQTNYILRGVKGKFNSVWFDEVEESEKEKPKVYIAVSKTVPSSGKSYVCFKIEFEGSRVVYRKCITSDVKSVNVIDIDTYAVKTCNNVYIVKVNM